MEQREDADPPVVGYVCAACLDYRVGAVGERTCPGCRSLGYDDDGVEQETMEPNKSARLTINRATGKATVEVFAGLPWKTWHYWGVVKDEETALRMLREGWIDSEGFPLREPGYFSVVGIVR